MDMQERIDILPHKLLEILSRRLSRIAWASMVQFLYPETAWPHYMPMILTERLFEMHYEKNNIKKKYIFLESRPRVTK